MSEMNVFDPVKFSIEENEFLAKHAGKPPMVALRELPASVNVKAVRPVLERFYELEELQKHSGVEWVGVDKVVQAIQTYLEESTRWALDRRRGRPRFPSMYSVDGRKRLHKYGPGSDSGQVRSYYKGGQRKPFSVELVESEVVDWTFDAPHDDEQVEGLIVNTEQNRIECPVCGHTESFKGESRGSFNAARARMSKHLRNITSDVEAHRELHTNEFGG